MILSRASGYALFAVAYLSSKPPGEFHPVHEIARLAGVPWRMMSRTCHTLARAGILRAVKGISRGVALARPASEIRPYDVVRLFERPRRRQSAPSRRPAATPYADAVRDHVREAQRRMMDAMKEFTFQDLLVKKPAVQGAKRKASGASA